MTLSFYFVDIYFNG